MLLYVLYARLASIEAIIGWNFQQTSQLGRNDCHWLYDDLILISDASSKILISFQVKDGNLWTACIAFICSQLLPHVH